VFCAIEKTCYTISMSIQAHQTPNPNALKFTLPNVHFSQPINISSVQAAAEYPVAAQLFALKTVYNVLMVNDFITVNKLPHVPWEAIQDQIISILSEHFCE